MHEIKNRLTPSLKASINDAICWSIMMGTGEAFLAPLGVYMEGTPAQVGMLLSVPLLVAAWAQFGGVKIVEKFRIRKSLLVWGSLVQALLWFPIALIPHLLPKGPDSVTVLLGLITVYLASGHLLTPGWNSLMGDLVPEDIRGRYFGMRNKLSGIAMVSALVCSSLFIGLGESIGKQALFFSILFSVAATARSFSAYWLSKMVDPGMPETKACNTFSLFQFIKKTPKSNFARFVFFYASFNFSISLGGPFLSVYMVRELHFSYAQLTAGTAVILGVQYVLMQNWGKISDSFGNKKVLTFCCTGICIIPFLWQLVTEFWHLVMLHIVCGFLFAGFLLASANYLFDAVTPEKRARCTAFMWIITATFMSAGSLTGGVLITYLQAHPETFQVSWLPTSAFMILMLISGALRILATIIFIPSFRELRKVERITHTQMFFRVTNLRVVTGACIGMIDTAVKQSKKNKLVGFATKGIEKIKHSKLLNKRAA